MTILANADSPKALWDLKQRQGSALHRICANHPDRPARARGLCGSCYNSQPERLAKKRVTDRARYAKDPEKFKARSASYAFKNRGKGAVAQRAWRARNREHVLWVKARKRAARDGLEFTITVDDVFIPETCPVLGVPLDNDANMARRANAPSLDRIDSRRGYVPGNVWVISHRANVIKNDATPDELARIAAAVRRVLGTGA
jgi:hypothetical protein